MTHKRINPIRIAVLLFLVLLAMTQLPGASRALDIFDSRPPVRILFIGNSHTFGHDMPIMVRRIADGAGLKQRYDITMHAPGGAYFADHWANPAVHKLLEQPWDHIILQGASAEPLYEDNQRRFHRYGVKLAGKANATGAQLWLYVKGGYGPNNAWTRENRRYEGEVREWVQSAYSDLAKTTGASLINVDKVWHKTFDAHRDLPLYEADHNHPSIHGSYLIALMMFTHISGQSPVTTTYRPSGVGENEAEYLQSAAAGGPSS